MMLFQEKEILKEETQMIYKNPFFTFPFLISSSSPYISIHLQPQTHLSLSVKYTPCSISKVVAY